MRSRRGNFAGPNIRLMFIFASLEDRHEIANTSVCRLCRPGRPGGRGGCPDCPGRRSTSARLGQHPAGDPVPWRSGLGFLQQVVLAPVVPRRRRQSGRRTPGHDPQACAFRWPVLGPAAGVPGRSGDRSRKHWQARRCHGVRTGPVDGMGGLRSGAQASGAERDLRLFNPRSAKQPARSDPADRRRGAVTRSLFECGFERQSDLRANSRSGLAASSGDRCRSGLAPARQP